MTPFELTYDVEAEEVAVGAGLVGDGADHVSRVTVQRVGQLQLHTRLQVAGALPDRLSVPCPLHSVLWRHKTEQGVIGQPQLNTRLQLHT